MFHQKIKDGFYVMGVSIGPTQLPTKRFWYTWSGSAVGRAGSCAVGGHFSRYQTCLIFSTTTHGLFFFRLRPLYSRSVPGHLKAYLTPTWPLSWVVLTLRGLLVVCQSPISPRLKCLGPRPWAVNQEDQKGNLSTLSRPPTGPPSLPVTGDCTCQPGTKHPNRTPPAWKKPPA